MSQNQWNQQARKVLKGAQESNDFFNTTRFKNQHFPIKIPLEYANLIDKNNPNDPLLKQVMPQSTLAKNGFTSAPLNDEAFSPVAGLIHKYPNRVLLIASQTCAIHCQYCFRQNFNYAKNDALSNWRAIFEYINQNPDIDEVILSGGDPLSLSDEKLDKLVQNIETLKHVQTLRIHTRSAVVMPSRITPKLADLLKSTRLKVVLVFHINHPQEISNAFVKRLKTLTGLTLLNQSVLLKGVNDELDCLIQLSLKLFKSGILPYYLHLLDKVEGAQHFLLDDARALQLHRKLRTKLSGYLVPKLVRDTNEKSKNWLF